MHPNEDVIHGYVEDALSAGDRQDLERHLESCADCRRLAEDLAEIRRVAASLELREPPARAWARLERAIELEGGARPKGSRDASSRYGNLAWLAAAAVLVVATAVGVRYGIGAHRAGTPSTAPAAAQGGDAPAPQASAEAVEAELRAAESHYDRAIKGLEQIATSDQNALDPKTAATLRKNLAVIDQAINESRAAVRAQPTSEPAVDSLLENFKSKLSLLQDTVGLINEMRKGNEAGTARIVSGLKQKGG
jgi:anti-sigma factor RsiW